MFRATALVVLKVRAQSDELQLAKSDKRYQEDVVHRGTQDTETKVDCDLAHVAAPISSVCEQTDVTSSGTQSCAAVWTGARGQSLDSMCRAFSRAPARVR